MLGHWCHGCGQSARDLHRSAWHLALEAFESFFHADGRLWRTLGRLISDPARLTHDFLSGKRAPQIPPLRLFLVSLLVLFLVGNWATGDFQMVHLDQTPAKMKAQLAAGRVHLGLSPEWDAAATNWLHVHLGRALAHPDALASAMRERAESFAFLMLPLSAAILGIIFAFRQRFVFFDHLVFSMHSLSFQALLLSVVAASRGTHATLLLLAPAHLFLHMKGVYGTGISGTLVRMSVLAVGSIFAFSLVVLALVVVGLEMLHD
jgi:hypothetical protein